MAKADRAMTIDTKAGLYDTDLFVWAEQQATLLRQRQFGELDLENLITEVESLGKSDRRAITRQLIPLDTFPTASPFSVEQALDIQFWLKD